jgi:ankyrin repeat protein
MKYIGSLKDFLNITLVCSKWKKIFDGKDKDFWHMTAFEFKVDFLEKKFKRSCQNNNKKIFIASFNKKKNAIQARHDQLLVEAKAILHGKTDRPSSLARLIQDAFPNTDEFNVNWRCETLEDNSLLTLAARHSQFKCMRILIDEYKANINVADVGGFTALINSAYNGHYSSVVFCVNRGVDISYKGKLRSGEKLTAEHWAAIQGHFEVFKYLRSIRINRNNNDNKVEEVLPISIEIATKSKLFNTTTLVQDLVKGVETSNTTRIQKNKNNDENENSHDQFSINEYLIETLNTNTNNVLSQL